MGHLPKWRDIHMRHVTVRREPTDLRSPGARQLDVPLERLTWRPRRTDHPLISEPIDIGALRPTRKRVFWVIAAGRNVADPALIRQAELVPRASSTHARADRRAAVVVDKHRRCGNAHVEVVVVVAGDGEVPHPSVVGGRDRACDHDGCLAVWRLEMSAWFELFCRSPA